MGKKHKIGARELAINVAVTSYGDEEKILKITLCGTESEAREELESIGSNEQLDCFGTLSLADVLAASDDLEIEAGFRIVEALMHHPTTREVLEALLRRVFLLGRECRK